MHALCILWKTILQKKSTWNREFSLYPKNAHEKENCHWHFLCHFSNHSIHQTFKQYSVDANKCVLKFNHNIVQRGSVSWLWDLGHIRRRKWFASWIFHSSFVCLYWGRQGLQIALITWRGDLRKIQNKYAMLFVLSFYFWLVLERRTRRADWWCEQMILIFTALLVNKMRIVHCNFK
jgi:hypothetical protein